MLNRYIHSPTAYEKYYEKNFYRSFLPTDNTYGKTLLDAVINSKTLMEAAYNADYWLRVDIGGFWHTGDKPRGWYNIYKNLLNKEMGIWCGEWSIIYEAAARAVNIPTIIIIALGEDHQFNNFWADGWHHVDPSSGSSGADGSWKDFFDDSLIYYKTWGKRIFSWPMEWEANGKYDHVWRSELPYNPPELLSDINFKIADKNGSPIDGARVELWSHWPMEGPNKYSTVPFPSAIGYSNADGNCKIKNVGHQNFTVYVVTRIGTVNFYTKINEDRDYTFDIKIPNLLPVMYDFKLLDPKLILKEEITKVELRIDSPIPIINGVEKNSLDAPPFIAGGRTMVPMRFISEILRAQIIFEPVTKGITIVYKNKTISIQIGSTRAYINREPVNIDVPPIIKNNRTFVPLRFIAEAFGGEVKWDDKTRNITIIYKIIEDPIETNINLDIMSHTQKNFHWIDAYNTQLKYIDYWKQDRGTINCIILTKKELDKFLSGVRTLEGYPHQTNGSRIFKSKITRNEDYYIILYNSNLVTSFTFKLY